MAKNPFGPTGMEGQGNFGKLGPNPAVDIAVTCTIGDDVLILMVRRQDTDQWALPGGKVDPSDRPAYAAAVRELNEETGLTVTLNATPHWSGPVNDPRNTDDAWFETTLFNADVPYLVPVVGEPDTAVEFRPLADMLNATDLYKPHQPLLHTIATMQNTSAATKPSDPELQAALMEYDKLKDESTERIKTRDNFVYLNLASISLIASFASDPSRRYVYLSIPWVSLCFGWIYLMNDEKVSALARYVRYGLRPQLGGKVFGWEVTPKRRTNLTKVHEFGQFIVDVLMFVVPTPVALVACFADVTRAPLGPVIVASVEGVLAVLLFLTMLAHSPLTKRWDHSDDRWLQR